MNSTLPLHMYIRPLTVEDAEEIGVLESQGFPPEERASEEVIRFRLAACPELCSGLFIREVSGVEIKDEKLIGHILGTKVTSSVGGSEKNKEAFITYENREKMHDDSSNTIAVHSIVIAPEHQKKNLATLMLTDYVQKMSNQKVADKLVLITHEPLVPFYERLGFQLVGENEAVKKSPEFSKNKWFDMVRELVNEEYEC
ncbi:polyamine acetyltransferase Ecym_5556 [Eremothecium cymbalariae DBVPG|uniref:N-acetyltransferase domain-containing protein n=1 Tax=Eremothecium cymbalariae (strain CBS 270.75 / DBVPG 7215 / KCTC 17166 / NRRL Y-17582) TaxID=931890 RepID=I6NE04_ERECY|nr:hypothetical protein Ecym_5556 [Eremothecium cymbalariae DBVPG\